MNTKKKPFRRYYKKSNNKGKSNNAKNKPNSKSQSPVREYKFHLHDSDARKTSESFEKIKEAIVLKIQKTFEKNADVATSIESGVKKTFSQPTMNTSNHANPAIAARQDKMYEI